MGGGALHGFGVHVFDYLFHGLAGTRVLAAQSGVLAKSRADETGIERAVTCDERASVLCSDPALGAVFIHLSLVTFPALGHRGTAYGDGSTLRFFNPARNPHHGPFGLVSENAAGSEILTPAQGDGLAGRPETGLAVLFGRIWARFADAIASGRTDAEPGMESAVQALRLTGAAQTLARQA